MTIHPGHPQTTPSGVLLAHGGTIPQAQTPAFTFKETEDRGHRRRHPSHQVMLVSSFPLKDPVGLLLLSLHPGFCAVLPRSRSPPSSLVPFSLEAADLLGTRRLSGYAAGAGVMAAVERGAAAETKRSEPSARAQRPEGTLNLHAAPRRIVSRSASPETGRPRGREARSSPTPPRSVLPPRAASWLHNPAWPRVCVPESRCVASREPR